MKVKEINGIKFEVIKDWTLNSNRYKLLEDYAYPTSIRPSCRIDVGSYLTITPNGVLTIRKGYIWDGPSGPTIDTDSFMRGSLVHDALYQLCRSGALIANRAFFPSDLIVTHEDLRYYSDNVIREICMEDGMWYPRYEWVYTGLRIGGEPHAAIGSRWRGDMKN